MVYKIMTVFSALAIILSFFAQVEAIAQDSAQQVITFTQDMNDLLPCATEARALEECSHIKAIKIQDAVEQIEQLQKDAQKIIYQKEQDIIFQ